MCERCALFKIGKMNKDKQISVIKELISATTELNGEFQEGWELVIEDAHVLAEAVAKMHEEIQKQIEAVRGLITSYHELKRIIELLDCMINLGLYRSQLDNMHGNIKTLTVTLKPHLNGEKLDV